MKQKPFSLLILLGSMLIASTTQAAIYKWVDESGQVNYSSMPPPPGTEVTRVGVHSEPPTPVAPPAEKSIDAAGKKSGGTAPASQQAAQQPNQENNAELKKLCEQTRNELSKLQQEGRLRVQEKDGSSRVLGDKEKTDRIKAVQDKLSKHCK